MIGLQKRRNPVEMLAEDFAKRLRSGERPSVAEYAERCPGYDREIRDLFPIIQMLEESRLQPDSKPATSESDADRLSLDIFGDYYIVREVGRGGMGIVYEARQRSLDRRVALKVLPANYLPLPKHVVRFKREAKSAGRLHHTNIVPIFGVGKQDETHYFVMPFIDGCNLEAVIRQLRWLDDEDSADDGDLETQSELPLSATAVAQWLRSTVFTAEADTPSVLNGKSTTQSSVQSEACEARQGGDRSSSSPGPSRPWMRRFRKHRTTACFWRNVAGVGVQVANALHYAHGQGVLHRDVKPSNLMIDAGGTVWVTDFGLAKIIGEEGLTDTHDTVGTLRYMAPEQVSGRFDSRSEIYSLGLTLYELATLQPAFGEMDRAQLVRRVVEDSPPAPRSITPDIPRDLDTILLKATARDPERRYQSAGELADDLQRFLAGRPIHARKTTVLEKCWRWCDRNTAIARLGIAVIVLVLTVAVVAGTGYVKINDALSQAAADRENARSAWREADRAKQQSEEQTTKTWKRVEELEQQLREAKQVRPTPEPGDQNSRKPSSD